jgi:chromatin assembly factor 1 subunit A
VQIPDYEKLFPSFFVKAHTRLALWNRFSQDEGGKGDTSAKLDRFLSHDGSSSVANTTSALRTEFDLKLLNTHLRRRLPRRGARLPVKEIVARLNGTAINPVDLTNPVPQKAVQNPINLLKAIPTKFLKFPEDVRPPYIGTYTKVLEGRTTTKLSRNPFFRALPLTDYEYDSEAEWEEPEEGEDLDSEGEEEVEEDDGEDMEGFLDDRDADEVKKRRPIIGDLEPTCTGLCWEDSQSNIHRFGTIGHSLDLTPFRLDIILGKGTAFLSLHTLITSR